MAFVFLLGRCAPGGRQAGGGLPFESIHFGKSQAYTNEHETYLLAGNGQLYKVIEGEFTETGKLSRSDMRRIGRELKELDIGSLDLDQVGTITYFVDVQTGGSRESISWTPTTLHRGVNEFYELLMSKID